MVRQSFIQFFDINTDTDGFKQFSVTAGGDIVHQRLSPFFQAYKYYKLGKVKVKCVPASTLPVDPTGLSYESGENTVDPRDQFNPGLVRITNGENVPDVVGTSYSINQYYATMLDPRWYKFRLQSGFMRVAKPLVWNLANNMQVLHPGNLIEHYKTSYGPPDTNRVVQIPDTSEENAGTKYPVRTGYVDDNFKNSADINFISYDGSEKKTVMTNKYDTSRGESPARICGPDFQGDLPFASNLYVDGISSGGAGGGNLSGMGGNLPAVMFQNDRVRLGWMPTDVGAAGAVMVKPDGTYVQCDGYSCIPEIELIHFILPQAFKTKYYYRVFIETEVFFKDPVVIDPFADKTNPVLPIDRFGIPARLSYVNTAKHAGVTEVFEDE